MDTFKRIFILIMTLSVTTSCGTENVLSEVSNKETDEAYYIDAKKDLDDMEWDSAVTIITTKMSAGYQSRRDVKNTLASAYAGKCGLIFMDLIQNMTNNSSTAMFQFFMGAWGGKTVYPDSCELAISVLQGIGTKAQRTTNENLFLSLLGVARIGTNLVANLDNGDHNGSMDADATVCHGDAAGTGTAWTTLSAFFPTPPAGNTQYMTAANMKRVAAGLGLILENIDSLTTALGSGSSLDGIDDIGDMCSTVMSTITNTSVNCDTMTTTSSVSDEMVYAMRLMLASSDFGLGSTCTVTGTTTFITDDLADYITNFMPGDTPPAAMCCPSTAIPGVE